MQHLRKSWELKSGRTSATQRLPAHGIRTVGWRVQVAPRDALLGIYTEQRRSPLKLALAFSTLTSSLSEALRIFSRPPAPLLLGGTRLG